MTKTASSSEMTRKRTQRLPHKRTLAIGLFVSVVVCISLQTSKSLFPFLMTTTTNTRHLEGVHSRNHSNTTLWCLVDRNTLETPYLIRHFPHFAQVLFPCWSLLMQARVEDPNVQCGLWINVSYGGSFRSDWPIQVLERLDCKRTHTQPQGGIIRRLDNETLRNLSWFASPMHAAALRETVLQNNDSVSSLLSTTKPKQELHIGLLQRLGSRSINNLQDLQKRLQQGYPTSTISMTTLSNFSVLQQATWFYHQDVIVSAHGAALTNVVFMRPHDSAVVELYPPHYYPLDFFTSLCREVGVHHFGYYNNVKDPVVDHWNHSRTLEERIHYRSVSLHPPMNDIMMLVDQAIQKIRMEREVGQASAAYR